MEVMDHIQKVSMLHLLLISDVSTRRLTLVVFNSAWNQTATLRLRQTDRWAALHRRQKTSSPPSSWPARTARASSRRCALCSPPWAATSWRPRCGRTTGAPPRWSRSPTRPPGSPSTTRAGCPGHAQADALLLPLPAVFHHHAAITAARLLCSRNSAIRRVAITRPAADARLCRRSFYGDHCCLRKGMAKICISYIANTNTSNINSYKIANSLKSA